MRRPYIQEFSRDEPFTRIESNTITEFAYIHGCAAPVSIVENWEVTLQNVNAVSAGGFQPRLEELERRLVEVKYSGPRIGPAIGWTAIWQAGEDISKLESLYEHFPLHLERIKTHMVGNEVIIRG